MKILEVTHRYPPNTGGVETHVKHISEHLASMGHDVTVVSADGERGYDADTMNGVKIRRLSAFAPGDAYYFSTKFMLEPRLFHYDVVHVHNYHAFPAVFAALGTNRARTVFTPHYHGHGSTAVRDVLFKAYKALGSRAMDSVDDVIAMTEWEAELVEEDFGIRPHVIPHGMDYDSMRSDAEFVHPFILTVGRLEKYKRVQDVIDALEYIEDLGLVVVGEGNYEQELHKRAVEKGVRHRIQFTGYVSDKHLQDLYHGAEVLVNISEHEAFGMVVGEALSSGTPAVVSTDSGLSRWSDTRGVVTSGRRPNELAAAIVRASDLDTDRRPLPEWSTVAEKTEEILKP